MQNQNSTWIVVANSSHAKIFRLVKFPKIEQVTSMDHPESRLHNQDLEGRKPGRNFQSGGTTRHAYQPETEPKEVEIEKFAHTLSDYISESHRKGEFARLYIMASPAFLGLLRRWIHAAAQKTIIAEVAKDMTERTSLEIEEHLAAL
jgi:protein required for attachment to host cells